MNLFRKIKLLKEYKRALKDNQLTLKTSFNVRIDRAYRIYTVLNIPEELYGEPYNLRKSDIDTISQTYIKEYVMRLSQFLNNIGLTELYNFYEPLQKLDKYSYLIVIGFKPMNTVKLNNILYFRVLPITITFIICSLLYFVLR